VRCTATLRVLVSSIITGIAGWIRLYIAFILLGKVPDILVCFAFSFVAYSVYTLDRALESKEDEVNRPEEKDANKKVVLFVVTAFLLFAILILMLKNISPLVAVLPFIIGFLYSKGLKMGGVSIKLKQGFGVKNAVVAFSWSFTIAAFMFTFTENYLQRLLIFIFFFFKSFIITVILDCKDVKGDALVGLITIPVYFGEARTKKILHIIHSFFHLGSTALIILNLVKVETIIILGYSWIVGLVYISLYINAKESISRRVVTQGEWIPLLLLRNFAVQLSQTVSYSS